MQLLLACGERERVDAIFDLVPLDEALRWSLCWTIFGLGWSSREAAEERAAAGAAEGLQRRGRLWCVQCAQWTVMLTLILGGDCDTYIYASHACPPPPMGRQASIMLTLILGGDLDVWTWV